MVLVMTIPQRRPLMGAAGAERSESMAGG